jgi:hypothetical protein
MNHLFQEVMRHVDRMGSHQWVWVLIGILLLGAVSLRGFGSRSQY